MASAAPRSKQVDKVWEQGKGSGLTREQVKQLGWFGLNAAEVQKKLATTKAQAEGMMIPYFDFTGKPTQFFRIKYLDKLPGFAGLVEKPQKYAQPAGTLNEVYLPPILEVPWADVAEDINAPIYMTEGEKKAACGCAHGLATIGLGGVDMWRATKRGIEFLPQLEQVQWKDRQVFIIFDSDAATNPNVVRAQRQLAAALLAKGAKPSIVSLPATGDGQKQGLDDLLVAAGLDALMDEIAAAEPLPEATALWELNEEVLLIRDPGIVVVRETGQRLNCRDFQAIHYSNRHFIETVTAASGATTRKKVPTAKRWMEWPNRHEAHRITYAPGQGQLVNGAWNCWPGWGVAPVPGDITPWTTILDHYFAGEPAARKWFEQWCAYQIQHPGVKLFTYALLWSREQGTGKSFLSYSLKAIFGRNGIEVGNEALRAGFNAWQENKQFVIGDEITAGEARLDADKLKRMICQPVVRINQKFLPEYQIPDCINYLFNSNHPDAMFMEDRDRRGFIWRVPDERLPEEWWKKVADPWLNTNPRKHDGPGPAYLMHHLLSLDLTGFNASAPAPVTEAKLEMIGHSKSDLGAWVAGLRDDPARLLAPLGERPAKECELFTSSQLLRAYDPDRKGRVSEPGMGRELVRSGFRQVNGGRTIRTQAGVFRLYAIRNEEKWQTASTKDMVVHFNRYFSPNASKVG